MQEHCVGLLLVLTLGLGSPRLVAGQESDTQLREQVLGALDRGKAYLIREQRGDGHWHSPVHGDADVGVTSLCVLALVNCGMTPEDAAVQKALRYLRRVPAGKPAKTYEVSLMISALVAAKADNDRDHAQIMGLARRLEKGLTPQGSWGYDAERPTGGDRSNAQFGILGLRDAASIGYRVQRESWYRARQHWLRSQTSDGGWGYTGGASSGATGSMTCAGIATIAITKRMLRDDSDVKADGTVDCCKQDDPDQELERAINWLGFNFSTTTNPRHGRWLMYYLYAVERAGRLTSRRFFGNADWYRAGARSLVSRQLANGTWGATRGSKGVIGTSFGLLFLSKGLARVVINKLEYGPPDPRRNGKPIGRDWNNHTDDIRNLVEHISGLPDWPRLMTHQTVNVFQLDPNTAVQELAQAPICYISGAQRPTFTAAHVAALRAYVDQGGFIMAVANCDSQDFDPGFRDLIQKMFPEGSAELKRLKADHPVFRAEYGLEADAIELYGVDFGCRTPIIYSPVDLACHWNKWMKVDPPKRHPRLKTRVTRDTRIGTNIIAYATGREPPVKLHDTGTKKLKGQERIQRGFLEIAKLKHAGGWDTAPKALRNLLVAVNEKVGQGASTKPKALAVMSEDLFNHPLVYMHGRNPFELSGQERDQLLKHLKNGNVLFADACCGSPRFDRSFRQLMKQMFPDSPLKRVPVDHDLITGGQAGFDISRVRRRVPAAGRAARFKSRVEQGEPVLEGIEVDGRLAVIYSKYDLSCALEKQTTAACQGYLEEDAVRIGINIVLHALFQEP